MIEALLNKIILDELGQALANLQKWTRVVATFPRELLSQKPERAAEVQKMIEILDKAKELSAVLDDAKKIVTVQKSQDAAPAQTATAAADDPCSCQLCTLRRSLTQKPAREASAVPTSSLDILIEMILGKVAKPTPAPTAEKAPMDAAMAAPSAGERA